MTTRKRSGRRAHAVAVAVAWLAAAGLTFAWAQASDRVVGDDPRFESAWRLVAERYWDLERTGVDWHAARGRFGALPDDGPDAVDRALEALFAELGDDHSRYVPAARVAQERADFGSLPCIPVLAAPRPSTATATARAQADGAWPPPLPPDAPTDLIYAGPVAYGRFLDGVGYVRVADLVRAGTAEGLRTAVTALTRGGAPALLLDLRGNPGGRLVTMMQAAGVFIRGFQWRALTNWSLPLPYPALGTPVGDVPLAVLVDAEVNSAAEGLAGALQAAGRAVVVGATTAGNVEAVLPFCLRDGAQAWLATGVLAPLQGPTWEGRGVVPDVPVDPTHAIAAARAWWRKGAP